MQFRLGRCVFNVELVPILFVLCGLIWASWHYISVSTHPDAELDDFRLIEPLFFIGCTFGILSIIRSIGFNGNKTIRSIDKTDEPFLNSKRLAFVIALPVYAIAILYFGFLGPSLFFVILLAFALGVRDWRVHGVLALIVAFLIWVVFVNLLGVPVPLGPQW